MVEDHLLGFDMLQQKSSLCSAHFIALLNEVMSQDHVSVREHFTA